MRASKIGYVQSAIDGFYKRCCLCVRAGGSQFKHMMGSKDIPMIDFDRVDPEFIDKNNDAPMS